MDYKVSYIQQWHPTDGTHYSQQVRISATSEELAKRSISLKPGINYTNVDQFWYIIGRLGIHIDPRILTGRNSVILFEPRKSTAKKCDNFEWPEGYITYEAYKAMKDERERAIESKDWDRYQELDDEIERVKVIPAVGVPGTVHYYTDSCSGHVERMITPKKLVFKETGIYHSTYTFTLRSNGRWVEQGEKSRDGLILTLGWTHDYRCEEI